MHDLGSMYQKKRNFVKCRKVFKRYLEAAPKEAATKELLSMMGLSCTAMGDISEGLTHYRNAIALDPDFKEAWLNLFQGLKECGRVCILLSVLASLICNLACCIPRCMSALTDYDMSDKGSSSSRACSPLPRDDGLVG